MNTVTRIALVGAGLVGVRHIDAIKQTPNVELCAIVDTSDEGRQVALANNVDFHSSISELFQAQTPDGVLLSTPTKLHVDQGLQCIEKNCPILVEKPVATSAGAAQSLIDAAESSGVPILVGHHRRHNPLIQKARELIDAGDIGDVRIAQSTCWLYKPDQYFEIAPWRKQLGAGPISVNLVHDVDLMRYLLGDVLLVQAVATQSSRGFENEDVAAAVLTFDNGAIGTISVSDSVASPWSWELTAQENPKYPPTNQSSLQIGGSKGSLSIPDLTIWTHQGERSWWSPISATSMPHESSDPLINQIAHFANVISLGEAPLVSGVEGMKTLQVIEAMQISALEGRSVIPSEIQADS